MNPPSVYQMVVDHFGALRRRFKGGWVHSIGYNPNQLSLIQSKTQKSLILPLTNEVGNALIRKNLFDGVLVVASFASDLLFSEYKEIH